ncbi:MAG TPA: hypothetical protein VFW70_20530 [Methylomirabilota bacterium]|nr:hypothetical protein [Methylomirabilota bacterium]
MVSAPGPSTRWTAINGLLIAVAAVALGQAIQFSPPYRRVRPNLLLTVTLLAAALTLGPPRSWPARLAGRDAQAMHIVLGAGLLWQLFELFVFSPLLRPARAGIIRALIAAAAVVIAVELAGVGRAARWRLPLLVAIHFALGVLVILGAPQPFIDVYTWHVEAFRALGQGMNPYAITMPNIYGHEHFYGPGLMVDGRLQFGYPYPPLSLVLAGAGHVLGGDYRYANLAAMGLTALLIGTCRPGRLAFLAAALFLFTPRTLFVLAQGWTEPQVALLLAATVWCGCRAPVLVPLVLGLFFAVKQYAVLAAPLAVLLSPAPWRARGRTLLKAMLVAATLTLPFVVADVSGFVRGVVVLQVRQPFRADSLSYPAWWVRATGLAPPPAWLALVVLAVALVLCLRYAARSVAAFAGATALASLVFFAFNKQAFMNYYFFVVAAFCCAVAATEPGAEPS